MAKGQKPQAHFPIPNSELTAKIFNKLATHQRNKQQDKGVIEGHHEADGLGSSATPVAGSAARCISRVGRVIIHLFVVVLSRERCMQTLQNFDVVICSYNDVTAYGGE